MVSALRILVVDDRLETISALVDQLQALRHVVDTTDSSMEALSLVARKTSAGHPYHLMISDLNMPLLDGVGLAKELRRRGEHLAIALISGYGSSPAKIRTEASDLRLAGILGKPHNPQEVLQLLSRIQPPPGERLGSTEQTDPNAFFGTGRITRTLDPNARPEEGALARARLDQRDQTAPVDMDALLNKATPPPAKTSRAEVEPVAPEFAENTTESPVVTRRARTPDPTSDSQPNGNLGTTSSFYKRPKTDPFVTAHGVVDPKAATPPPGTSRDPVTGHYKRQPSGLYQPEPNPIPGTTSRFRRDTNTPTNLPGETSSFTPPGQPSLPPAGGITSGFRRSLTGRKGAAPAPVPPSTSPGTRVTPTPPVTTQTCTVSCAHCNGLFQVLVKPAAYTVLCVHCGQLNRIDPLPNR